MIRTSGTPIPEGNFDVIQKILCRRDYEDDMWYDDDEYAAVPSDIRLEYGD